MAEHGVLKVMDGKRWTAKKKSEVVLEIIKGRLTLIDFCRANDLKQSEVQQWIDDFVKFGAKGLSVGAKNKRSEERRHMDELKKVVGEQALQILVLKKSIELQEEEEIGY